MKRDLNFTAPLSLSVDGKFGGKNKDGTWNGMVGMLTRNETDVVLAALGCNSIKNSGLSFGLKIGMISRVGEVTFEKELSYN